MVSPQLITWVQKGSLTFEIPTEIQYSQSLTKDLANAEQILQVTTSKGGFRQPKLCANGSHQQQLCLIRYTGAIQFIFHVLQLLPMRFTK